MRFIRSLVLGAAATLPLLTVAASAQQFTMKLSSPTINDVTHEWMKAFKARWKARLEQLEESVGRYLAELDRADREPAAVSEGRVSRLKEKISSLKAQMQRLNQIGAPMHTTPDHQVSWTDPDARSMATSGRGKGIVGYNVQAPVDAKHHLIVAHELTHLGHDRTQLSPMSQPARRVPSGQSCDRRLFLPLLVPGLLLADCEDRLDQVGPRILGAPGRKRCSTKT